MVMEHVDIREFLADDFDEVMALWQRTEGLQLFPEDVHSSMADFLAYNAGLCFVAVVETCIIGAVLCGNDGKRGHIYHLAVDTTYRNQGIGTALIDHCLVALAKQGVPKCRALVLKNNEAGLRYWANRGWTLRDELMFITIPTPSLGEGDD